MTVLGKNQQILWQAQPGPQTALIQCPVFEVLFGGARGGGKTEASLGDWMEHQQAWGKDANGVFFRKNQTDLDEVIERAKELFCPHLAKWNENKHTFYFFNGARLKFRYLERDKDAAAYQGHSYTRLYFEEVTQYASPAPIMKLKATLRSRAGVPCGMRMTANPGGPGHVWVKGRYIDPDPRGYKILYEEEEIEIDGIKQMIRLDRVFIPSKIRDNMLLLRNDPSYLLRLKGSGSEALVKAWLDGDWSVVDGAFFSEFNPFFHVLDTQTWLPLIPRSAPRIRAFDWGSAKPFSVGWYAVSDGTWGLPPGALVKYREWYGTKGENQGLKLDPAQIAQGIKMREGYEVMQNTAADPAVFIRNGGPSIAETMAINGVGWSPADNKRLPGWEQLHLRLNGEKSVASLDGGVSRPMLYFLDCCADTIRTLPLLQHDETNAEDVDSDGEDHAGDETRYACMSRPWYPTFDSRADAIQYPKLPAEMTFQDMLDRLRVAKRRQEESSRIT